MAETARAEFRWQFSGIPVAEYEAAIAWYERFFGRAPDVLVADNEAMWQVIADGWVYVVGDAGRAGHALLTLAVRDLDAEVAARAARGLTPAQFERMPGGNTAAFLDPEGNRVTLAQIDAA